MTTLQPIEQAVAAAGILPGEYVWARLDPSGLCYQVAMWDGTLRLIPA